MIVKGFPNSYKTTEDQARQFFETKFGPVVEVVFAWKFGKIIHRYWKWMELNKQLKIKEIKNKIYEESDIRNPDQIQRNKQDLEKLWEWSEKYD